MTHQIDSFITTGMNGRSGSTQKAYRYSLERFNEYLEGSGGLLDNLTRLDVQSYVSWMQTVKKKAASSVLREYAAVAAFCHWSNQDTALKDIRLPQAPKILNVAPKSLGKNDRNRLLRDVERTKNLRNMAIINLLIRTGLRVAELVSLNRNDVKMGARRDSSYITIIGKGNKERKIPLSAEARQYLKEYLDARQDNCEALFATEKGSPKRLSVRAIQKLCSHYEINPHMLRHTRAKSLVDAGVDLSTVAEILGHADINVTRRYTKPTMDEMLKAMDKTDF
ncbi:tyrosine-type recombinase/integrase [Desulfosporosinus sp. SB140]|uniref:tyrosine-type recombinase/integrase n=1 Tax=Desulfosporosinus paludis TaxID=3115649 RepID=UPI00388ED368